MLPRSLGLPLKRMKTLGIPRADLRYGHESQLNKSLAILDIYKSKLDQNNLGTLETKSENAGIP